MLTRSPLPRYADRAGAKSSAGFGDSNTCGAQAPFLMALFSCRYGGCAWDTFGYAGFHRCRFANLRTVAPNRCLATAGDDSTTYGASPMAHVRLLFPTRNPSARASAHRAMARAALLSDSSANTRLKRYNHHMTKARRLEAVANGQEVDS